MDKVTMKLTFNHAENQKAMEEHLAKGLPMEDFKAIVREVTEPERPEIEEICGNCKHFHLERGNSGRCAKFDDLTDRFNSCDEHEPKQD